VEISGKNFVFSPVADRVNWSGTPIFRFLKAADLIPDPSNVIKISDGSIFQPFAFFVVIFQRGFAR